MKKITIAVLLLLICAALASAQSPDLSKLPKGKWLDSTWSAVWEIGADSIRILDTTGAVIFDFKDKITDFKVDASLTAVTFSFRCAEAERSYVFTKATSNLNLTMEIDPDWTTVPYKVEMAFQR